MHANQTVVGGEHNGKRVGRIQALVAKEAEYRPMRGVAAALGNNVDHAAAGLAMFRKVIGPIDLKLHHGFLAYGWANAPARIVRLAAVDADVIPAAVRTIEGEPAVGRLFDSKAVGVGQRLGIVYARSQQAERQVI